MSRPLWTRFVWLLVLLLPTACEAPPPGADGSGPGALEVALTPAGAKCTTDLQCDDGNSCTANLCKAGKCTYPKLADGSACEEGNLCTLGDTCKAGVCRPGARLTCTALDTCHKPGVCNPATGVCTNPVVKDGLACQDGDACTVGDTCKKGVCKAGPPRSCDDSDVCTTDACDPAQGCVFQTFCDDGDGCTADSCAAGICHHTFLPMGTPCDDGDPCTLDDACVPTPGMDEASCYGMNWQPCDDGDPCTWDSCDPVAGCTHGPACQTGDPCVVGHCDPLAEVCIYDWVPDGVPCDATSGCMEGATCQWGECRPLPGACDDGDPCTVDWCDPFASFCQHDPSACNDGNPCTVDTCDSVTGACSSEDAVDGADCSGPFGSMCITGSCLHGRCRMDYFDWSRCDDDNPCTWDHCAPDGTCVNEPTSCDDGNVCTTDGCDPAGDGCTATPVADGTDCAAGDPCLAGAVCQGGQCTMSQAGCDDGDLCTVDTCRSAGTTYACYHSALPCDDGNPCTVDACDPDLGVCVNEAQDEVACDDGNLCTEADACVGGWCQGDPLDCDDGDPSTIDTCEWWYGGCWSYNPCYDGNPCTVDLFDATQWSCSFPPAPDGAACDDGTPCTMADACQAGACVGSPTDGAACEDWNYCTVGDTCVAGACGVPRDCDDGDPSSVDVCEEWFGECWHYYPCQDGNPCTVDVVDPEGGCSWTQVEDGASCHDGNPCMASMTCLVGACVGVPVNCDDGDPSTIDVCEWGYGGCLSYNPCDDGNPCTDDVYDADLGCARLPVAEGTACDDGNACTEGEACSAGACGVPVDCDDANACTTDWCDGGSGCQHQSVCDDENVCTDDVCDPATGECLYTPVADGTVCSDFWISPCVDSQSCQGGLCVILMVDCNDGDACSGDQCYPYDVFGNGTYLCMHMLDRCNDDNPCTADACDHALGCQHELLADGTACDDGNPCTTDDACEVGVCASTPVDCDDGDPCTEDSCVWGPPPKAPMPSAPEPVCAHYNPCDDGNLCTVDGCDGQGGCTYETLPDGTACADGWSCTTDEYCQAGRCVGVQACADGDPCTYDDCWPWYWGEDSPYDCGNSPMNCNDGNSCTTETCEPGVGCVYVALDEGAACDDGSNCTTDDVCTAGFCVGTPSPEPCIQCDGPCPPGYTYEGCCDGDNLMYCADGILVCGECPEYLPCGWSPPMQYYGCNGGGPDPSGTFPMECPGACQPACDSKVCGDDGCGGSCGTCALGEACVDFQCVPCTPSCEGKECGGDGCGGLCDACPAGMWCGADEVCHGSGGCLSDADCDAGYWCDVATGKCVSGS